MQDRAATSPAGTPAGAPAACTPPARRCKPVAAAPRQPHTIRPFSIARPAVAAQATDVADAARPSALSLHAAGGPADGA